MTDKDDQIDEVLQTLARACDKLAETVRNLSVTLATRYEKPAELVETYGIEQ